MALCNDCVCRNQCGNDNVTFCISYVKEVPTKWELPYKIQHLKWEMYATDKDFRQKKE